jgi:hypothetical protein
MSTVYTDGKKHKYAIFKSRKERDAVVKQLRSDGWQVECSSFTIEGVSWYEYEAVQEKGE